VKIKTYIPVILLLSGIACGKEIATYKTSDPAEYKMKFLPAAPVTGDEIKLIVYDDCNYNILKEITQTGNSIQIMKQFNSMMMRPCFIQNDTLSLGKLSAGDYIINYRLMDLAFKPPKATVSVYFNLTVAK